MRGVWLAMGVMAVLGAACDQSGREPPDAASGEVIEDTAGGEEVAPDSGELEVVPPSLGCSVSEQLFAPFCERCHHQGDNYPDLSAGALKYLIGAPAIAYPEETLVVAGDLLASFLYRKVHAPAADEGAAMPPEGALVPPEAVTALEAWIAGGAPGCDSASDPGPMPVALPQPSATLSWSATPLGFQATKPSWSEEGSCSSGQWWKYSGTQESANMHPGQACIACHTREREGPSYSYAGTVFANLEDPDDCRGVAGVTVEILDADDAVIASATSNSGGNFYVRKSQLSFRPYRARLTLDGREREMQLHQTDSGDCNTCHDSAGANGALGRIVAP